MKKVNTIQSGFTLIELLIVVAIIAILAAIAVPNFLEAQTRSKVSRAKSDMRSMATAMNAYRIDNNNFIIYDGTYYWNGPALTMACLRRLTSPIAYITSIPASPFTIPARGWGNIINPAEAPSYGFVSYMAMTENYFSNGILLKTPLTTDRFPWLGGKWGKGATINWEISSEGPGPRRASTPQEAFGGANGDLLCCCYDPTNGTTSFGSIWWTSRGPSF